MVDFSPHRSLVAPFLAVLAPLLWFLNREASIRAATGTAMQPAVVVGVAAVAVACSYIVAAVVAPRLPAAASLSSPLRPLVAPSDATLALVGVVTAALSAVVFASLSFPSSLDTVASAAGVVVGWPAFLAVLGATVFGGLLGPSGLASAAEVAFIAVGISLSMLWVVVLAGQVTRVFDDVTT